MKPPLIAIWNKQVLFDFSLFYLDLLAGQHDCKDTCAEFSSGSCFLTLNSSITYLLYYLISSICFVFLASTIQHELIFPFSFLLYLLTPAVPLLGPRVS